jgi:hypothetical protein
MGRFGRGGLQKMLAGLSPEQREMIEKAATDKKD